MELTLPADCPSQSVLHELTRRRATIDEMSGDDESELKRERDGKEVEYYRRE